jgi:trigger factor
MAETPSGAALRVDVKEESPSVRLLEVEAPRERVARAFDEAYAELAGSVRLRGFRPGKAPRSVLRKLYGKAVAEDVERALAGATLREALEQTGLEPVTEPTVEAVPPEEGAAFAYRARVEVRPPIALGDLAGLEAHRPSDAVDDADVERELESVRQRHAVLVEEPEGTPAAPGHFLTIDFEGRVDGRPFAGGSGRNVTVELGAGQLLREFDDALVGACVGDARAVRVHLPEDERQPALAGRDAEFQVHVASLRRREVPALDDELAKDAGDFETLGELRAHVRSVLERLRAREVRAALRRSLVDSLIARVPFEVPLGLVEERLRQRLHAARHELEERGVPAALIDAQLARWEASWRPEAERDVREDWLLDEVARAQALAVDEAEVEARLRGIAERTGREAKRLRRTWRESGALDALRHEMLQEKAVEFLLAAATVRSAGP